MPSKRIYRVRFQGEGKIFELYARDVSQGALFGFIEVAQLVWGSKSEVIVDPSEQDVKNEFAGVNRVHIPMHAVIRVDEVERGGSAKVISIAGSGDRVTPQGLPVYTPSGTGRGKPK